MSFFQTFGLKWNCHRSMEAQKDAENRSCLPKQNVKFPFRGRRGYEVWAVIYIQSSLPDQDADFWQQGNYRQLFVK